MSENKTKKELINEYSHELNKEKDRHKKLAKGKSSKDCSVDKRISVYLAGIPKKETPKERLDRINAFRSGW